MTDITMSLAKIPALLGQAVSLAAGLAYLDAKLSLRPDIRHLWGRRMAFKEWLKVANSGRISVYYLFETAFAQHPDAECVWSRAECLTYAQAYRRVNQYAAWFLSRGLGPGDHAALMMINSADFVCAWMGLIAIGATPALINTNLASKALVNCVEIARAKVILADGDGEILGRLEGVRGELEASGMRIFILDAVRESIYSLEGVRPADELRKGVTGDSPMALVYTSGTTGLPKALAFPMFIGFMGSAASRKGFGVVRLGGQRCYNCMPFYHVTGGLSAILQLLTGETLCIAPRFHASTFWADIRDSRATWFVYVGEVIRYLLAQPPSPLDRQHGVHTVWGNGLRADVWVPFRERFGVETIHEVYNSTELMFGLSNPCRGDFTARSLGIHGALLRAVFSGWQVPVAVDAETGDLIRDAETGLCRRVPLEQGGEILVRLEPGSRLPGRTFRGYWGNDSATAKKMARDVLRKGDVYYRTGDALRRDREGRWYFCDRLGDTFRWKGENVSTTEVGEVLGAYPGVTEAVVYGVQLPGHEGRAGAVALLLEEGLRGRFDAEDFLRYSRAHLPKYAVPIFIRMIDTPYATGNHKQNKVPLKSEGVDTDKVSNGDEVYWIQGNGKGDTYVPFTKEDWRSLHRGSAKL